MKKIDPLDTQVGGTHYKGMRYQPIAFMVKVQMNAIQSYLAKYILRYKKKGGKEDLQKAIHIAEIGKELQPKNFCVSISDGEIYPTFVFELGHFVAENQLSVGTKAILVAIMEQNFQAVIENTENIIINEYRD
jgi:hypothetical protein